jgi:vacuolar-type H+-ATPase subunit E/Vma4
MALDDLLAQLTWQAAEESGSRVAEARKAAEQARAATADRLARRRAQVLSDRESDLGRGVEQRLAEARRAGRGRLLQARRRCLDRVFAAAAARLAEAARRPAYRRALPAALETALACLGGRAAIVRCPPDLRDAAAAIVGGRPGITVEADAGAAPGFQVRAADGSMTIDESFEARLARLRPRLGIEILRRLEPLP